MGTPVPPLTPRAPGGSSVDSEVRVNQFLYTLLFGFSALKTERENYANINTESSQIRIV